MGGLLADEFVHSTTPPSEQEIDQRTTALVNPSLSDVYFNLHKARAGAERGGVDVRAVGAEQVDGHRLILVGRPALRVARHGAVQRDCLLTTFSHVDRP